MDGKACLEAALVKGSVVHCATHEESQETGGTETTGGEEQTSNNVSTVLGCLTCGQYLLYRGMPWSHHGSWQPCSVAHRLASDKGLFK